MIEKAKNRSIRIIRYLESIGRVAERRISGYGVGEKIELVIGAVVAVAVKAIAAISGVFRRCSGGLLLVVFFHEILYHFIQTNRTRLEFSSCRTVILFSSGGRFLSR